MFQRQFRAITTMTMALGFLWGAAAQAQARSSNQLAKTYGSRTAPITMEVFSDYQCPSCRTLFEETEKPLITGYVAEGKVFLIHRDFPLPVHQHSWQAARYANAAAKIGKFAQVDAALFDNQSAWAADGDIAKYVEQAVGPEDMKKIDKLMEGCKEPPPGVDQQGNHGCALDPVIEADVALGRKVPVTATPTFRITCHGKSTTTTGTVTYAVLKQYFDYLLSH